MSREALMARKMPIPVLENFTSVLQTTTMVSNSAEVVPATTLNHRRMLIVQNNHASNTVYIGTSTVTADTTATGGYQLGPSDSVAFTLDGSAALYAIASAAGDTPVTTLEFA